MRDPDLDHIKHGQGRWSLAEFEWDPQTGTGHFRYERPLGFDVLEGDGDGGVEPAPAVDLAYVVRPQPIGRQHAGWRRWNE